MIVTLGVVHATLFVILVSNLFYLRRRRVLVPRRVETPFVSVLIPARNEEANLPRLLTSLFAQTYPAFEVVVVDDASTDGTWKVLSACRDERLKALRSSGPPSGWVGKVHALVEAVGKARGAVYLFLDADAELADPGALDRLMDKYATMTPGQEVMTGMTRLRGGGSLLTSLIPNAILSTLPWFLVGRRLPSLGALNGQCWLIDAPSYQRLEPHRNHPQEVLEDVVIGRSLAAAGVLPRLFDLSSEVSVHMYQDLGAAWRGFRKNAYLMAGGTPPLFLLTSTVFTLTYLAAPLLSVWFLASIYGLKLTTDRLSGFSLGITLLAPISFLLGLLLQWDSAVSHWRGRVRWKSRAVG